MGLDLWFQQDVARILASTQAAMAAAMRATMDATPPLDAQVAESYRQGFGDALRAIAVAFGVAVPGDLGSWQPACTTRIVDAQAWRGDKDENGQSRRNGGAL
jgi:hypothetical protein